MEKESYLREIEVTNYTAITTKQLSIFEGDIIKDKKELLKNSNIIRVKYFKLKEIK